MIQITTPFDLCVQAEARDRAQIINVIPRNLSHRQPALRDLKQRPCTLLDFSGTVECCKLIFCPIPHGAHVKVSCILVQFVVN